MTLPVRSLRLQKYNTAQLDRMSYEDGEIFYDDESDTLRIMNGQNPGGRKIATQVWTNGTLTTNLIPYATLTYTNTQLGFKAPIANPAFTGTVTGITATMVGLGNVTNESKTTMFSSPTFTGTVNGVTATQVGLGNVTNESKSTMFSDPVFTGTVTGNVTGALTGNADTATALATARTINNVSFNGGSNITISTLVNSTATVTLGSTGLLTIPGNITAGAVSTRLISSTAVTLSRVDAANANLIYNVGVDNAGAFISFFDTPGLQNQWRFSTSGNLSAPGNITTTTGIVSSNSATVTNNVQAGTASVTNDITVGANVNISTLPTEIQHATNKKYVDSRALAFSIALG